MRAVLIAAVAGLSFGATGVVHAGWVGMQMRFDEGATIDAQAVGGSLAAAQVYRMYAVFDEAADVVVNVFNVNFGTTNGSTLFQTPAPFGGDTAPNSGFFGFDPTLPYDSFVTLNEQSNTGSTTLATDADFAFSANGVADGGWFNNNPPNLLGQSQFNSQTGFYEVLVGQFTLESVSESGFWLGNGGITFNQGIGTTTTQLSSWAPGIPGGLASDPIVIYPTPGSGALLALGGIAGAAARRRR
ncbi:MAG: hypothetical protein ACF8QF_11350 [Phycisphaerales bacterium]